MPGIFPVNNEFLKGNKNTVKADREKQEIVYQIVVAPIVKSAKSLKLLSQKLDKDALLKR